MAQKSKKKDGAFKKAFSKSISFLHLWLGLATGIVLFIVATTGCILTFEDELTPLLYHAEQKVEVTGTRLSADSLVSLAKVVYPKQKIFRLWLPAEADQSVKTTFGTKKKGYSYAYLNPYSGKILSKGKENKRFFAVVLNIHRFLLAGNTGKVITGISCAITFSMTLSGLYLWWPGNKKVLKQRTRIKTNASNKRLNWDLHAVGGFYAMVFLFIITTTGLIWSYDWVENLMFKIADGQQEKVEVVKEDPALKTKKAKGLYSAIASRTNQLYPNAGDIMITFPDQKGKPVVVSKENAAPMVSRSNQLYFNSKSGDLIQARPFSNLSLGSKIRKMNKAIHTGSILGWPTKTIAFLTALITASLPITGFLIWLGRGKKKKAVAI